MYEVYSGKILYCISTSHDSTLSQQLSEALHKNRAAHSWIGADATEYVWFLGQIYIYCTVQLLPLLLYQVRCFMRRIRSFLGQCTTVQCTQSNIHTVPVYMCTVQYVVYKQLLKISTVQCTCITRHQNYYVHMILQIHW